MECCTKITFGKIKYFKIKFSEHAFVVTGEFIIMTQEWDKENILSPQQESHPCFCCLHDCQISYIAWMQDTSNGI